MWPSCRRILDAARREAELTELPSDEIEGYLRYRLRELRRQGDAKVFKKCSQMKLQMKPEALQELNRTANESAGVLGQAG